jgi:hypothetical protein
MPDDKEWVKPSGPIVVAMDVKMPHLDGSEATRKIAQSEVEFVVIGLSVRQDRKMEWGCGRPGRGVFDERDCRTRIAPIDFSHSPHARPRHLTFSVPWQSRMPRVPRHDKKK